jgi:hypothetical protein
MWTHGDERLLIEGCLNGRRVRAVWQKGRITGDLELLLAAGDVIAGRAEGGDGTRRVRASYATLSSAVVALCRAVDTVSAITVTLPDHGSEVPLDTASEPTLHSA